MLICKIVFEFKLDKIYFGIMSDKFVLILRILRILNADNVYLLVSTILQNSICNIINIILTITTIKYIFL